MTLSVWQIASVQECFECQWELFLDAPVGTTWLLLELRIFFIVYDWQMLILSQRDCITIFWIFGTILIMLVLNLRLKRIKWIIKAFHRQRRIFHPSIVPGLR